MEMVEKIRKNKSVFVKIGWGIVFISGAVTVFTATKYGNTVSYLLFPYLVITMVDIVQKICTKQAHGN